MTKRKSFIFGSIVVVVFLTILFIFSFITFGVEVKMGGSVFRVEIADTGKLQERGLSGRKNLSSSEGMLFVFDTVGNYGFWMKDMNFAIDIIWIGPDFKIVYIEKNITPETYPKIFYSNKDSLYAFEVLAGTADRLNLKIGDSIKVTKNWL